MNKNSCGEAHVAHAFLLKGQGARIEFGYMRITFFKTLRVYFPYMRVHEIEECSN